MKVIGGIGGFQSETSTGAKCYSPVGYRGQLLVVSRAACLGPVAILLDTQEIPQLREQVKFLLGESALGTERADNVGIGLQLCKRVHISGSR